ncbi:MAG TPA: thioredoxin domain-containing protein, partial [Myxococcales bacterium]|nr:thioredoxin domain-containing protein [Myxococcales bacterium]
SAKAITPPAPPAVDGHPPQAQQSTLPKGTLEQRKAAALRAKGPKYVPRTRHKNPDGSPKHTNRLIFETSPYLLQHAHNPVNWRPWGDKAFAAAKAEDKPILMSVGYATCHWCHVMEEESFEDPEIAAYMNDNYVCIKMDREERPDVDAVYMSAVHALAGRGGWPMTVVMNTKREPFFAGTYFPPRDGARGSRKGFLTILKELKHEYTNNRSTLMAKAAQVSARLGSQSRMQPATGVPGKEAIANAATRIIGRHDKVWGGFGRAPKFPRPATLDLLLRQYKNSGDKTILDAVTVTLDKMIEGGIHDQIGGGFHRYSTDTRWLVPHFEKMLYDNGQLAVTLLDLFQITKNPRYSKTAQDILDYVIREMRDPTGALWSATDADSEGEEGTFFVWTPAEITQVLGAERGNIANRYWGVTARGNFEHKNILHLPRKDAQVATELGITVKKLLSEIEAAKKQLYAHRKKRIPPLTDDKVLTAWNGLMISALARGAFVLGISKYADTARTAADFILKNMRKQNRLLRTWRNGQAKYTAYLEDYAFFAQGLLDLYEATGEVRWLKQAAELQSIQNTFYLDTQQGGYYQSSHDAEQLLTRDKPTYDGAQPSGNSIAARNLLRLWEYTGKDSLRQSAEQTFKWCASWIQRGGTAVPAMLSALDHYHQTTRQVIIVRASGDSNTAALMKVLRNQYLPNRMIAITMDGESVASLAKTIPYVDKKKAMSGRTTAYVCERGICQKPTSDPVEFGQQLALK